jgi:hypothetical protein
MRPQQISLALLGSRHECHGARIRKRGYHQLLPDSGEFANFQAIVTAAARRAISYGKENDEPVDGKGIELKSCIGTKTNKAGPVRAPKLMAYCLFVVAAIVREIWREDDQAAVDRERLELD